MEWYGGKKIEMLITSGTSIWTSGEKRKLVWIKWVLIKYPTGKLNPILLACTNLEAAIEDIVRSLSVAGRLKSPSRKFVAILGWKRSANGRT